MPPGGQPPKKGGIPAWLWVVGVLVGGIITALAVSGLFAFTPKPTSEPPATKPATSDPVRSVNLTVFHSKPSNQHPLPVKVGKWKRANDPTSSGKMRLAVYRNGQDDRDLDFFSYMIVDESSRFRNAA